MADQFGKRSQPTITDVVLRATRTLGLIVTNIQNPFFPELVQAADDTARAQGFSFCHRRAARPGRDDR